MTGRPRKHHTPEALAEARKEWRARSQTWTVKLDRELVAWLNAEQVKFEAEMGFKPSLSQTMRHLLMRAKR
jgi:hypothetical protein